MTAIKKTTSKSAKSPAPATKSAAPAPKAAPKKKAAPAARNATPSPAVRATTQAPVAVVRPPAPAAAASAPTIKAIAAKPVATRITARIDIGFGNALYLRGEGPGLSWDKGVLMNCLGSDQWEITLAESTRPYAFKFLVNDLSWSAGVDYTVSSGQAITLTPEF